MLSLYRLLLLTKGVSTWCACLVCRAIALVFKMAFMALIDPLILLLVRCDCLCADLPEGRPVVVPFYVQFSAYMGLLSSRLQQFYVGVLFGHRLRLQWSDR